MLDPVALSWRERLSLSDDLPQAGPSLEVRIPQQQISEIR